MKGPIVIIVVGMAIVGLAVWLAVISLKFLSTASRAEGKVVDMAQTKEGLWSPVIEFVTSEGKTLRVQPDSASSSPQYEKGQSVDVLYKPDDPQTWRLKSFSDLWLMSVIIGALGVIVVVAGVGFKFMDNSFMAAKGHSILLLLGVAVFGFVGILMLWGAWRTAGDTRKFLKEAAPATGK